jgi:hypothetical protein
MAAGRCRPFGTPLPCDLIDPRLAKLALGLTKFAPMNRGWLKIRGSRPKTPIGSSCDGLLALEKFTNRTMEFGPTIFQKPSGRVIRISSSPPF